MKFTITSAFLLALQFGTAYAGRKVSPEGPVEDEVFWQRFMENLDSMAPTEAPSTVAPTGAPSDVPQEPSDAPATSEPTDAPTPDEVSFVPTGLPTPDAVSFVPTDSPTVIPTTAAPTTACSNGNSIEFILCNVPEFSTLCEALATAGLSESLGEDLFTIFAPTNDAFDMLPESVADELAEDDDLLRETLLHHAVPEMELRGEDLVCGGDIMMASREETTTLCTSDGVFQVGLGNAPDAYPQLIARDGVACNGIIHAIDEVLLPSIFASGNETEIPTSAPTDDGECESLGQVICTLPQFEILCALVGDAGLTETLMSDTDDFTIFAPVNSAFESLSLETADAIISDPTLLQSVLLIHVASGDLFSTDLECGAELAMVSGAQTTTICEDGSIFQVGAGNPADAMPEIISTDGVACNGVIHAVDRVILPPIDFE